MSPPRDGDTDASTGLPSSSGSGPATPVTAPARSAGERFRALPPWRNRNVKLRVKNVNTAAMWREGQTVSPLLGRMVF